MKYILFLLALYSSISFAQTPISVEIRGVHDGDSYLVKLDTAQDDTLRYIRVRLLGCDAPEVWSPYSVEEPLGRAIGDTMRMLFRGQKALLIEYGVDKYGRVLGKMYVGDVDLSHLILRNGWGTYLSPKPLPLSERRRYQYARDYAKRKGLGIWALPKSERKNKNAIN